MTTPKPHFEWTMIDICSSTAKSNNSGGALASDCEGRILKVHLNLSRKKDPFISQRCRRQANMSISDQARSACTIACPEPQGPSQSFLQVGCGMASSELDVLSKENAAGPEEILDCFNKFKDSNNILSFQSILNWCTVRPREDRTALATRPRWVGQLQSAAVTKKSLHSAGRLIDDH